MGRLFHYFEISAKNSVAQKPHCMVSLHDDISAGRTQNRVAACNFHFGCKTHKNVSAAVFAYDLGVTQNRTSLRSFHLRASKGSHKNVTRRADHFSLTCVTHEIFSSR
jgi:hypothetical protein